MIDEENTIVQESLIKLLKTVKKKVKKHYENPHDIHEI
jgi:hypothetical protein